MLKYVIAMTEAGLPIILLLGFFAAFVRRAFGPGKRPALVYAALPGAVAAVVLVLLKKSTGFVVREYYNLAVLLPLLLGELVLAGWAVRVMFSRGSAALSAAPVDSPAPGWLRGTAAATLGLWLAYYLPYPLFFPFDFHVGMESVFTTQYAAKVMGWCLGAALLGIAFLAVRHLTKALSVRAAFGLFVAALLALGAAQAVAAAQIALVRGYLPRRPGLVGAALSWIVFAEGGGFLFIMVFLTLLLAATAWVVSRRVPLTAANPALVRKIRAAVRRTRRWGAAAAGAMAAAVLSVTVGAAYENREVVLDPPATATFRDGAVRIPVASVSDGKLYRFVYTASDGTAVRYIVIKKNESAFGVGLDACDVCGPSGYYERDGQVVCILCDVVMNKSTIGFPGGCNPVPLAFRVADGDLVIEATDLEAGAWRFKGDHLYRIPTAPTKG